MNQKTFANIILAVIALIIVAISGYFVLSKKSATPTTPPASPAQIQDPKPLTSLSTSRPDSVSKTTPDTPTQPPKPPSPNPLTDKPLIKVIKFSSVGTTEEPISVIEPPEYKFKLSPFDRRPPPNSLRVKELTISGNKILIEALQAYEDDVGYNKNVCTADRTECFKVDDWMVVSVNGTNVELAREDIVEVVFENNIIIYISAVDIEGSESSSGSDLIVKKK